MRLSIFNFKPIRQTVLFFIGSVTLAGGMKLWALEHAPKGLRPLPGSYWMHKTHTKEKFDMLILGDSRVYRGVSPAILKSALGDMEILNFSFSSAGMSDDLFKGAEKKLKTDGRKMILLGITPYSLTHSAALNEHYNQFKKAVYWPFKVPFLTNLVAPHETVWALNYLFGADIGDYYQIVHKDGWIESDRPSAHIDDALDEYKNKFSREKISNEVINELLNQVRLWKAQGVTVFAFRPPASEKMESIENELSGFYEDAFKGQFAAAGGMWLDIPERYSYETYDGSHLKSRSAQLLSKTIAQLIATRIQHQ